MRYALISAFVLSISSAMQANAAMSLRAYFVPQCSFAAQLMGKMAISYRNDKENRSVAIRTVMDGMFEMKTPQTPTVEQFNAAFITMESILVTESDISDEEYLKGRIIGDAAAVCMAASLEPQEVNP